MERISLPKIVVLKVLPNKQFQLKQLFYVKVQNIGISYHSSLSVGPCIFIVGGNTGESLNGTHNIIMLNNETMSADVVVLESAFQCSGHSCINISDDCVMICGGRQKQYFVYTSKPMVPGACDLNDECKIIESVETCPPYHGFSVPVRGKYICKSCKSNTKYHPARRKKKKT